VEEVDTSFDCKDAKQEVVGSTAVQQAHHAICDVLRLEERKRLSLFRQNPINSMLVILVVG